jgi:hypothetical protein
VILGAGNRLCFGQRHEDGVFIVGGRVGGINPADREQLLIYIAIGGVDQQVDLVANVQSEFIGEWFANQDAFAIIDREKVSIDQTLPKDLVWLCVRVYSNDLHAFRLIT